MTTTVTWRLAVRLGTLAAVALAAILPSSSVLAVSERYQYKMPCPAGVDCYVTQLAHSQDALDFDIGGGATSGPVRAVSEGEVIRARWDVLDCDVTDNYLGRYVQVQDIFGRTLTYAHLSQFDPDLYEGKWVLQGDKLGTEGDTGYTWRWDEQQQQYVPCGVHLHLTNVASLPYIDNEVVNEEKAYNSTNSVIGETSTGYRGQEGQAIRNEYFELGAEAGNWSWWAVGWTGDIEGIGSQGLWMRRPTAYAGWHQTFAHDPYLICSGESGIYVADLNLAAGYWVDYCSWHTWHDVPASNLPGGSCPGGCGTRATGYPRSEMEPAYCPPELPNCTKLQAFHFGYLWWPSGCSAPTTVACPDVNQDRWTNILDVQRVALNWYYGTNDKRCDVNADTVVNILDPQRVAVVAWLPLDPPQCYQTDVPGGQLCPAP
jgi:hypothetical protein